MAVRTQVSEKSLANLRMHKQKKEGYNNYQYRLPQAKVDELFTLLADNVPLYKAAKKADICRATAKKYFDCGDPTRGIKPLKQRLMMYQERISVKLTAICEEKRIQHIENVTKILTRMNEEMFSETMEKIIDDNGNEIMVPKSNFPKFSMKDYERMVKLQMFLLGATPGSVGTEEIKEGKIMTADEIMAKESEQDGF